MDTELLHARSNAGLYFILCLQLIKTGNRCYGTGSKLLLQVFIVSGNGNHGCVISGVLYFRNIDVPMVFPAQGDQCLPKA